MYHIVFIVLLFSSIIDFSGKQNKHIAYLLFIILLLFVSLRFGQGSDYFSYIYLFNSTADAFSSVLEYRDLSYINQEIGFSAISYFWLKILNLSPDSLNSLFSAISFIMVWLFIKKYSDRPIICLFIYYCTFYLIYPFSVIRQALCIGVFIYYMIPLLHKREYLKYYMIGFGLFLIHYSSAVMFFLPVVNIVQKYKLYQIYLLSIIFLAIGLVFFQYIFSFFSIFDLIGGKVEHYTKENSLDILSLLLRLMLFVPIMQLTKIYPKGTFKDTLLKIYVVGFFIYLIFLGSSLISSRLNVYMRYFEAVLLVDFLLYVFRVRNMRVLSFTYIVLIMSVLYVKNINSFISQGPYYSHINVYNYPYISVFNKKDILNSRNVIPSLRPYINL